MRFTLAKTRITYPYGAQPIWWPLDGAGDSCFRILQKHPSTSYYSSHSSGVRQSIKSNRETGNPNRKRTIQSTFLGRGRHPSPRPPPSSPLPACLRPPLASLRLIPATRRDRRGRCPLRRSRDSPRPDPAIFLSFFGSLYSSVGSLYVNTTRNLLFIDSVE
jgi:hypothetical protein